MSLSDISLTPQSNGVSITTTDVQQANTIYFQCTDTATETHLSRLDSKPPAGQSSSKKVCTVQISIWGPPKQGSGYPVPSKFANNSVRPHLFTSHLNCTLWNTCCQFFVYDFVLHPLLRTLAQTEGAKRKECGEKLDFSRLKRSLLQPPLPGVQSFCTSQSTVNPPAIYCVFLSFLGTCNSDNGPLRLEITSASQSVTFACGNDQNLTPKLFDQICQSDGCESTAPLADTLAGASLVQHASQEGNPNTPAYTLSVPQLPDESQTLFYKCATGTDKDSDPKECNVVITVAKAADGDGSSGPSSDTATIPPETSGTGAERWSKSLAFFVFSVALLLTKMI
ncbi:SAG2 related antigen SAG2D, related [Neospora caninum Liverpool]|uniref:SRS domain-containing protein n=1 Tax=Neospora caninum (strain Liverpool) TaxID=572307 RepID=F0VKJ8_NEOCL|nr:SAG2 related antigen SAG2D, related [Neospora caninum Liverpool]CBZ54599.1 SAG2 related antigen SAG2D, related [Neospora caninum Liverpool]CEL69313.1 TPA: SAG2 related antigen SAG2D, related [Neospora caninum Liverpool]|eukprot:XP_003884629.1 SAG2 related antigen SAG2D, related [Neospora caninum Liverpool]